MSTDNMPSLSPRQQLMAAQRRMDDNMPPLAEAVLDELITAHIYSNEHETNPRKAIKDAIEWNVQIALDPNVSSDAQALIDRGAAEAARLTPEHPPADWLNRRAAVEQELFDIANAKTELPATREKYREWALRLGVPSDPDFGRRSAKPALTPEQKAEVMRLAKGLRAQAFSEGIDNERPHASYAFYEKSAQKTDAAEAALRAKLESL